MRILATYRLYLAPIEALSFFLCCLRVPQATEEKDIANSGKMVEKKA